MSTSGNDNEKEKSNIFISNINKQKPPSSLKNGKFKGLTSEEIIKKYENVLFSREKQFNELSNEITKLTQIIQNLVEKKNKSKYNNDKLKEILEKNEKILKQELSNKEIAFMKLTDLEHKYDDLQNKIDDIINKQNALAESKEKKGNEESIKLIDKNSQKIKEEKDHYNNEDGDNNVVKEKELAKNKNIIEETKEKFENKDIERNMKNEIKMNENNEKKENKHISARERLNRLKEKKEKVQKLNLSELINQTNNNNNNS